MGQVRRLKMNKQKVIKENLDLGVFIGVDSISDEEKPKVDKRLEECGL